MTALQQAQQELLIKEMRVAYWERNHNLPSMIDLESIEMEVLI